MKSNEEIERKLIEIKDALHEAKQWHEVERAEDMLDELIGELD